MRKYLGILAGFWIGFSTSFFMGFHLTDWQWWAVCIPTIVLLTADKHSNN